MNQLMKLIIVSLSLLCLSFITTQAQDAANFTGTALDFSRTYLGGTARIQGFGGAQTALGGDISAASSNPAGLGFFNRSEFSFSPTLNFINSSSDYLDGQSTKDSKFNLNFANLGVVLNKSKSDLTEGRWRGGSFGISINRVADFQNRFTYNGNSFNPVNNGSVILDPNQPKDFLEYAALNAGATSTGAINFNNNDLVELAYETYLIDVFSTGNNGYIVDRNIYTVDENGNYILDENENLIPAYPEPEFPTHQSETVNSRGGIYQTSFAYGGNYNDRIYFGASLGILSLYREVERIYIERPTGTDLDNFVISDEFEQNGIGVNATLGLIGRPITSVLLGLSYTTPTYFGLEQTRELTMTTNFIDETFEHGFIYAPFNYNVRTPSRLSGGITYFFGKNGFITGDVERVNYSGAKLSSTSSTNINFDGENNQINKFESALNYRVGGEYRFGIFRARAGYSYLGDATDDDLDQSQSRISFGAGARTKDYYIDLGVVNNLGKKSTITPYPYAPEALVENTNTTATISVGFFF